MSMMKLALAALFLTLPSASVLADDDSAGMISGNTPQVDAEALQAAIDCNRQHGPLKFLLLENEAVNAAIEDDIRRDLAEIGF